MSEERKKRKLWSLPRKLLLNVYTLQIKLLFQKKRKLNRLHYYCWKKWSCLLISTQFLLVSALSPDSNLNNLCFSELPSDAAPTDETNLDTGLWDFSVWILGDGSCLISPCCGWDNLIQNPGSSSVVTALMTCLMRTGIFSHSSTNREETRASQTDSVCWFTLSCPVIHSSWLFLQ